MKWYARDPHRATEGMLELTLEECGAYNLLLDHSYARDGNLPDDPHLICRMLHCHGHTWRRLRASLLAKGKIDFADGLLYPNGVQTELKHAANLSERQSKRAAKRWEKFRKANGNNESGDAGPQSGRVLPTTPTPTPTKKESKSLNGHGVEKRGKPRHGQRTKDGKRVWFDRGTFEWMNYAAQYAEHHGYDVALNWDGAGSWFNYVGESMRV